MSIVIVPHNQYINIKYIGNNIFEKNISKTNLFFTNYCDNNIDKFKIFFENFKIIIENKNYCILEIERNGLSLYKFKLKILKYILNQQEYIENENLKNRIIELEKTVKSIKEENFKLYFDKLENLHKQNILKQTEYHLTIRQELYENYQNILSKISINNIEDRIQNIEKQNNIILQILLKNISTNNSIDENTMDENSVNENEIDESTVEENIEEENKVEEDEMDENIEEENVREEITKIQTLELQDEIEKKTSDNDLIDFLKKNTIKTHETDETNCIIKQNEKLQELLKNLVR